MVRICSAALLIAAFGCGTPSRSPMPDASPDGADPDGAVDGPNQGLVSVVVNSTVILNQPLPDAPVLFIEPDGTTTRVMTDALGQASAVVSEGASVTVKFDENRGIATILGVKPGDHLVFGNGPLVRVPTLDVTFSAYTGDVDSYRLFSPCGSPSISPGTTRLFTDFCFGPATSTNVVLVAYKDTVAVASTTAQGVDLTTGAVTLTSTWSNVSDIVLDYSNVPTSRSLNASYVDMPENFVVSANPSSPPHDVMLRAPSGAQSAYVRTWVNTGDYQTQQIFDPLPTGATNYQLDVAAAEQPWLSQPLFTASTRSISVQGVGGQTFDVVVYVVTFGNASNPLSWSVYSPDLNGVVLPVLPADLDPIAAPLLAVDVLTVDAEALTGWDAVRSQVFPLTDPRFALPFGRQHVQLVRTL